MKQSPKGIYNITGAEFSNIRIINTALLLGKQTPPSVPFYRTSIGSNFIGSIVTCLISQSRMTAPHRYLPIGGLWL